MKTFAGNIFNNMQTLKNKEIPLYILMNQDLTATTHTGLLAMRYGGKLFMVFVMASVKFVLV